MAITNADAARQMAEQHPELHQSRQIAFGENYLQDLEQGTGTSQYYTGFGLAPDWVTGAIGAPAEAPIVQDPMAGDAQVAEQIAAQDRGDGITAASAIQPTISDPFLASGAAGGARLPPMDQAGAVAAMTPNQAYAIPGQMPKTPVSGAWGPQDYLQPEDTTLNALEQDIASVATEGLDNVGYYGDPSYTGGFPGDVTQIGPGRLDLDTTFDPITSPEQINIDPRIVSEEQGLSGDPKFWESAKNKFLSTGEDVGNFFTDLKNKGMDIAQMTGSAIMNAIQPGLNLLGQMLPQESPIDKFNREYQLGGDLYENVVSQVEDPKFGGRLEGYADDLISGNIGGKDPFGINTVSQFGDYPAYATETYNELIEKQKQRATEDKELIQFDKDRLDYYGHVSGLTGKTNIPGTPLMVDTSPLKTFPGEDIIIPPEKPKEKTYAEKAEEAWEGIIERQTIAGNDIYVNKITGEVFPSAAQAIEAAEAGASEAAPTDIIESGDFEEIGGWEDAARLDAERKIREENERAARAREEAAQRSIEEAAAAAAQRAATMEAQRRALQIINAAPRGDGGGGGGFGRGRDPGGGAAGSPFRKGGRVRYGNGGIVDLL